MSKVTIYLSTQIILRDFTFFEDRTEMVRTQLPHYTRAGSFFTELTGEEAAKEAFDLTNNPFLQEERELKCGRGRGVSTGDVIEVDGVKYLCMSVGWEKL
jgi:hypothetical protein